ncbi:hypothetical protein F5Y14DRAFT_450271 [Nemania sp. NC0429]|nr:hypothetical protein F5Y14DRAFT_450271 [Nemania sp. NC0429]
MDASNGQNATYPAHSGSEGVPVRREMPGPLSIPPSPMALIREALKSEGKQVSTAAKPSFDNQTRVVANFIVPGEPCAVKGVIEAVYRDLTDGNRDAEICLINTGAPYIRVVAPTEEDALALVRTAQRLTTGYLSGLSTATTIIFVEPPRTSGNFQISMGTIGANGAIEGARPTLEILPGTPKVALKSYSEFSENLCEAFENASSLHTSLMLKIHIGCYILKTYKKGNLTLEEFERMIKSPRATGKFATSLGESPSAGGFTIEKAIGLIQAGNSPCFPMDNQTTTSADVKPTYVLECWHEEDRYETDLDIIKLQSTNRLVKFALGPTKVIPQDAQAPRNLDWKLTATIGDKKAQASTAVKQYLGMGHAELQGSRNDFRCYPSVELPSDSPLTNKLKSITMKSVYRFSWKGTGYVVQFTINRRWPDIRGMHRGPPMGTDFDVIVYGQNWEDDCRAGAGQTVGKIWGKDLRGLLRDEDGDTSGCALGRVQGLIRSVTEIRDFFDVSSRT